MTTLDHFNLLYQEEILPTVTGSLVNFLLEIVFQRLQGKDLSDIKTLELGCGSKSIFEDQILLQKKNITAIDFSVVAINKAKNNSEINYQVIDLTKDNALGLGSFDLIFDSHCLHCVEGVIERQTSFKNIFNAMTETGIFCAEMMVQSAKKKSIFPSKHIPEAFELEQELISAGFKISYFMISRNLVFHHENGECDLLRVICRK